MPTASKIPTGLSWWMLESGTTVLGRGSECIEMSYHLDGRAWTGHNSVTLRRCVSSSGCSLRTSLHVKRWPIIVRWRIVRYDHCFVVVMHPKRQRPLPCTLAIEAKRRLGQSWTKDAVEIWVDLLVPRVFDHQANIALLGETYTCPDVVDGTNIDRVRSIVSQNASRRIRGEWCAGVVLKVQC